MNAEFMPAAPIPVLVGPTGIGKSETAFLLAQTWRAEILSADAFQVYRGLSVGTAQPPREHLEKVPHHLVGCLGFETPWSSAEFARRAAPIIVDCQTRNKNIIVVGGAGFYLKALVEGIPSGEAPDPETRSWIEAQIEQRGSSNAHQWLRERDPQSADRIHANDLYRIGRALEKSYSAPVLPAAPFFDPRLFRFYGLEQARFRLDIKLKERTETMWRYGLLNEVKLLKNARVPEAHPVWAAIGYREAADFLAGTLSESQAKEKIFRRTRQYAKRQWTWFKRQHLVHWINLDEKSSLAEAADFILSDLQKTKGDS